MSCLFQTLHFLQSPSFWPAQPALIGQLAQCIVIERTPHAWVKNVSPLSIIVSFSFLILREHLGSITGIFPLRDVDMWGCVLMSRFRGAWQSLNFDKEYLFGFEIYAQSACNTPKRKENLKSHHMTAFIIC